jgi:hypothetical protein
METRHRPLKKTHKAPLKKNTKGVPHTFQRLHRSERHLVPNVNKLLVCATNDKVI